MSLCHPVAKLSISCNILFVSAPQLTPLPFAFFPPRKQTLSQRSHNLSSHPPHITPHLIKITTVYLASPSPPTFYIHTHAKYIPTPNTSSSPDHHSSLSFSLSLSLVLLSSSGRHTITSPRPVAIKWVRSSRKGSALVAHLALSMQRRVLHVLH